MASRRTNPSAQYKAIKQVEKKAGVSFGTAAAAYSASGGNVDRAVKAAKAVAKKNPAKFDRCVRDVKKSGSAVSPYAVCTAAGTRNRKNPMTGAMVTTALGHSAAGRKAQAAFARLFKKNGTPAGRARRKNPMSQAEEMYELFHGLPPKEIIEVVDRIHVHSKLTALGDLISMKVVTEAGRKFELFAPDPDSSPKGDVVIMCINESYVKNGVTIERGTQAYFIGGDQEIPADMLRQKGFKDDDFREHMTIGVVTEVTYRTRKSFEKNGEDLVDFYHTLGKEHSRGALPTLVYKPRDPSIEWFGGRYKILPEREDIGASPGIGG